MIHWNQFDIIKTNKNNKPKWTENKTTVHWYILPLKRYSWENSIKCNHHRYFVTKPSFQGDAKLQKKCFAFKCSHRIDIQRKQTINWRLFNVHVTKIMHVYNICSQSMRFSTCCLWIQFRDMLCWRRNQREKQQILKATFHLISFMKRTVQILRMHNLFRIHGKYGYL